MIRWQPDRRPDYGYTALDDHDCVLARVWPAHKNRYWSWQTWPCQQDDSGFDDAGGDVQLNIALIDADVSVHRR